jgi:hypothetical protein
VPGDSDERVLPVVPGALLAVTSDFLSFRIVQPCVWFLGLIASYLRDWLS